MTLRMISILKRVFHIIFVAFICSLNACAESSSDSEVSEKWLSVDLSQCILPITTSQQSSKGWLPSNAMPSTRSLSEGVDSFSHYLRGNLRSAARNGDLHLRALVASCQPTRSIDDEVIGLTIDRRNYSHDAIEGFNLKIEQAYRNTQRDKLSEIIQTIEALNPCPTSSSHCPNKDLNLVLNHRFLELKANILLARLDENSLEYWQHMNALDELLKKYRMSQTYVAWFEISHPSDLSLSSLSLASMHLFQINSLVGVLYSDKPDLMLTHPYRAKRQYTLSDQQHKRSEISAEIQDRLRDLKLWLRYEDAPFLWAVQQALTSKNSLAPYEAPNGLKLTPPYSSNVYVVYCGHAAFRAKVELFFSEIRIEDNFLKECQRVEENMRRR